MDEAKVAFEEPVPFVQRVWAHHPKNLSQSLQWIVKHLPWKRMANPKCGKFKWEVMLDEGFVYNSVT